MSILRAFDNLPSRHVFAKSATPTTALFTGLLADSRPGDNPMRQAVPVACLKRLIAARAWTDAALALVALRLPEWQLRRLDSDDGQWHCALSRQPTMPEWLDDTVEAHHPNMALAIVSAKLAATAEPAPSPLSEIAGAHPRDAAFEPVLCENFA
jgi:hypothetical protein